MYLASCRWDGMGWVPQSQWPPRRSISGSSSSGRAGELASGQQRSAAQRPARMSALCVCSVRACERASGLIPHLVYPATHPS